MNLDAQDSPGDTFPQAPRTNRPPVDLSDFWRAPLHDLPVRDEILFQYLPLSRDMKVLEVGRGSGHTAFRAAKVVREITLVDIGVDNTLKLRHVFSDSPGLRVVCADVCDSSFAAAVGGPFDAVWAIEMFEFLADPRGALANLASVLRPGGTLLVQFPNYPEPRSPGPTHYRTREALDHDLRAAGFEDWKVYSLALSRQARWIYSWFHERPLSIYRRLRIRRREEANQNYDQTWALQQARKLGPSRPLIHAAWASLVAAMRLSGPVFERRALDHDIFEKNLVILARRAERSVHVPHARGEDGGAPGDLVPNSGPYHLERLSATEAEHWDEITGAYETRELFHRKAWLDYLASSRGAQIRLWRIWAENKKIGYFCAGFLQKGPFRILGSPLRGWGTNFMGPIVHPGVDQGRLLDALDRLCREEGVAMTEVEHPIFGESALSAHGYERIPAATYIVDLHADSEEMWSRLSSSCRNRIRKAQRLGLKVEETQDRAVADEFYDRFEEVMGRKRLVPSYPRETARQLVRHLGEADLLLGLRVRDALGRVLAVGLFPHDERTVYFWGGAGGHDGREACPNELLHWHLMQVAAERKLRRYNMCGDGRFKRKFGGTLVTMNRWRKYYWPSARTAHRAYEVYHQVQISLRGHVASAWRSLREEDKSPREAISELGAMARTPPASRVAGRSGDSD